MDKKVETILNYFNDKAGANYTVLEKAEILRELPKKLDITEQEFTTAVSFLQEKEYITVKFQDKREICVAVTPRTGSYLQYKHTDDSQADLSKRNYLYVFLFGFLGSFFGAFLALVVFKLLGM